MLRNPLIKICLLAFQSNTKIWGQFNKTFTVVIYKCSYCFQLLKQRLHLSDNTSKSFTELTPGYIYIPCNFCYFVHRRFINHACCRENTASL